MEKLCFQVQGIVQDRKGKTAATLFGKWDESMHYVSGDCSKGKGQASFSDARVLWKSSRPSMFATRYNFTRFAITLNELTHGLKVSKTLLMLKFWNGLKKQLFANQEKTGYLLHGLCKLSLRF